MCNPPPHGPSSYKKAFPIMYKIANIACMIYLFNHGLVVVLEVLLPLLQYDGWGGCVLQLGSTPFLKLRKKKFLCGLLRIEKFV
jgi:hypothetical protein